MHNPGLLCPMMILSVHVTAGSGLKGPYTLFGLRGRGKSRHAHRSIFSATISPVPRALKTPL